MFDVSIADRVLAKRIAAVEAELDCQLAILRFLATGALRPETVQGIQLKQSALQHFSHLLGSRAFRELLDRAEQLIAGGVEFPGIVRHGKDDQAACVLQVGLRSRPGYVVKVLIEREHVASAEKGEG